MPIDELEHGNSELLQHFAALFGVPGRASALEFVRAASLRRRVANKMACPCGSSRRLGRCHNRRVNRLRALLDRSWFRRELLAIEKGKGGPHASCVERGVESLAARVFGLPHAGRFDVNQGTRDRRRGVAISDSRR
jgi:hypothetical protein